jgi:hypothetical protein
VIATRRGYRIVTLVGRSADGGHVHSKTGTAKHQPIRTEEDYFTPIATKQVRAVILEAHTR